MCSVIQTSWCHSNHNCDIASMSTINVENGKIHCISSHDSITATDPINAWGTKYRRETPITGINLIAIF